MAHVERDAYGGQGKIRYSSKLIAALNKFAGVIATEVKNPMVEKFGDAYDHLIQGDAYRAKEQMEDAIRAYEKAIAANPGFAEAYTGMGKCFRRKGDLKRALMAYTKALDLNMFDKNVHLELAKSYNEAGMPKKGIQHFRQAIKLDPGFIDAKFNLALCLELQGELKEPTQIYQDIIKQDPEFLPAYNNLGSIYMRQGLYAESEKMFRWLITNAPDFSRGYLGLAISLDRSNHPQEALQYYEKLLVLKAHTRNKDYVESRVVALRQTLRKRPRIAHSSAVLVRVK